jgi:hypothetical protein
MALAILGRGVFFLVLEWNKAYTTLKAAYKELGLPAK